MNRLGWIGLCLFVLATCQPACADDDPGDKDVLSKILADWQKRRDRLPTVRYSLTGSRVWTKGSFNDPSQLPGAPPEPDNPEREIEGKLARSVLFDFPRDRHRIEWDDAEYDNLSRQPYRIHCVHACDGQVSYSRIFENSGPPVRDKQAKRHVDLFISRGLGPPGIFNFCYTALFLGQGIVTADDVRVRPGNLSPKLNPADLTYHGQGFVGERPCAILRLPPTIHGRYQLWVDVARDSAVLKVASDPDRPRSIWNLRYRQTPHGWLPESWDFSTYFGGRLEFAEIVKVTEIVPDPPVADADFRFEIVPGMYVEDETYFIDPQTGKRKSESKYYRAEEGGGRTELDELLYPSKRASGGWRVVVGLLVLAVLVVFTYVIIRRRARRQTGGTV